MHTQSAAQNTIRSAQTLWSQCRNEEGSWDTPDAAKLLMRSVAGSHGDALASIPASSGSGSLSDLVTGAFNLRMILPWIVEKLCVVTSAVTATTVFGLLAVSTNLWLSLLERRMQ